LLNNVFELRVDAKKLLFHHRYVRESSNKVKISELFELLSCYRF
jgi:hypothetical protein